MDYKIVAISVILSNKNAKYCKTIIICPKHYIIQWFNILKISFDTLSKIKVVTFHVTIQVCDLS
jgi:hypothetical protein